LNTYTKVNKNLDFPQISINPKLSAVFSNSGVTVGIAGYTGQRSIECCGKSKNLFTFVGVFNLSL
jgi:hypothetical protein